MQAERHGQGQRGQRIWGHQESTWDLEHCQLLDMRRNLVTVHETAEASQLLVKVRLVKMTEA